jgi:acyl carrier protein
MTTIEKLAPIFHDIFDDDTIVPMPQMTAEDVEEWDSLAHIRLMVAIERAFGIKFATSEMNSYANVGELVAAIDSKVARK